MITIRISQILLGEYEMIRRVEIPKELLVKLETYIYLNGGVLLKTEEEGVVSKLKEKHFRVKSPLLLPLVKDLEKLLKIKFVEERPNTS